MVKNLLKCQKVPNIDLSPKRLVFKGGETSGYESEPKPKVPQTEVAKPANETPKKPGNVFDVFDTFKTGERVPASSIRLSPPYFKSVDEYEKNAKGEILSPWSGLPMTPYALFCAREADAKYPAIYKIKHDVPPDTMPAKLELPAGKELFVFGGPHNGRGVADRVAGEYKNTKLNFYSGNTLEEMLAQAKGLSGMPKDKLDGSTATIMVDPEVFFGDKDAKTLGNTLTELCKTLKDYGMKVTVSTAAPIGGYFDDKGGLTTKESQMSGWKKTEAARDKRSYFNEAIRKLFLAKNGVDKVLETDMAFQDYQDSARMHPDYINKTGNASHMSAEAFDLAARIWASGINAVNGAAPADRSKDKPRKQVGTVSESIEINADIPAKKPLAKTENFSGKERLNNLIQVLKDMADGKFPDKPRDFKDKALADLEWAKTQEIDVGTIEKLEKDLKTEMPKLLVKIAEQYVQVLKDSPTKPTEYNTSLAIAAIDEAEKAGVDKEKIVSLKKAVREAVEAKD